MRIDMNKKYFYVKMKRKEPFACVHLLSKTGIPFMLNENRFRPALFETREDAAFAVEKAKARYGARFDVFEIVLEE